MSNDDLVNEIKIGSVFYLREDLDNKVYLFDILQTAYPEHMYLYYMVDDERPYKRSQILTQKERRKILIEKILK